MITGVVCILRPCGGDVAYSAFLAYGGSCFSLPPGDFKVSGIARPHPGFRCSARTVGLHWCPTSAVCILCDDVAVSIAAIRVSVSIVHYCIVLLISFYLL